MENLEEVRGYWNWLPAFRAVAEREHLSEAASELGISPSALSRTIGQLERYMECSLFDRQGRGIQLNDAGRQLFATVRDSMERIDREVRVLSAQGGSARRLFIDAAPGAVAAVAGAVDRIHEENPEVGVYLQPAALVHYHARLLRGQADIAFVPHAAAQESLNVVQVGEARESIYCGRGHSLFGKSRVSADEVAELPFVATSGSETPEVVEGWPAEMSRRIAVYASTPEQALAICRQGRYLAVLPDAIAQAEVELGRLTRLRASFLCPQPIYAVYRHADHGRPLVQELVEGVKIRLAEIASDPSAAE